VREDLRRVPALDVSTWYVALCSDWKSESDLSILSVMSILPIYYYRINASSRFPWNEYPVTCYTIMHSRSHCYASGKDDLHAFPSTPQARSGRHQNRELEPCPCLT
jgi:hypothetical protein